MRSWHAATFSAQKSVLFVWHIKVTLQMHGSLKIQLPLKNQAYYINTHSLIKILKIQ